MILAWHGEPKLKAAALARLGEHQRLDQIVQGQYWTDGRGCQLGCLTHDRRHPHASAERLFGIEERVGYWLEAVFEGLPSDVAPQWVLDSAEAIPVGADLSRCHHRLCVWIARESGLLAIADVNRAAIEQVTQCHEAALRGETPDWSAAESAWLAAESATWLAAWLAARSAAWSARSAAWSARSAAWSAAWERIAAASLRIFREAPVVIEREPIEPAVQCELCGAGIWCEPDSQTPNAVALC